MEITCQVILSNPQEVYCPGQTVSGFVECSFPANKFIRGIRVKLRGKEYTDYVKRKQYFDSVENEVKYKNAHRMNSNGFLEIVQNLIGEGTMLMGRYKYPFSFNLPVDIPSNYQGTYAYIQYCIKANVDVPFDFDPRGRINFDVFSPINFNTVTSELSMNPVTYQDQKSLGFCCWASEPITMAVHLQKEAFVEGEIVEVAIDVTNMADENVDQIIVKITRTIEAKSYHKHNRYKKEKVILASAVETGVGANGQRKYDFNLTIPRPGAVYNLTKCQNLKQWFTLSVEAVFPNLHRNMKIKTKLILGHIPLGGLSELHGDAQPDAIRIKLRGKELTDYAERDKYFDKVEKKMKYEDIHYMGANRFLEIVHDLVGEGIMTMGRYEYPFYFTLPLDIPSSYEGTYAYIRYYIKANVDIPFAIDYSGRANFEVHSPIDFNRVVSEIPMSPVTYQTQKTLGFCCCASKPITMAINLPKEAFVEGKSPESE